MTTRRTWSARLLAACAVATLVVTLGPDAGAVPAPVTVGRSAVAVAAPYSATPPAGISCRAVAQGSLTYSCVIGRSVEGRAIVATRQGNAASARVLVVSGQMHGEEWPGPLVVDQIRAIGVRGGATFQILSLIHI